MAIAQLQDLLTAVQAGTVPAGLVYVRVISPLGVATVDPFAASQDPTTQAIMQRLGIQVEMGFGQAPAPQPGEASLLTNLSIGATIGIGAVAYLIRPKVSTLVVVGAGAFFLQSGLLGTLAAKLQPKEAPV